MAAEFTDEDDALLRELGVAAKEATNGSYSSLEQRVIAGFEEIQRFVDEYNRVPEFGADKDLFERLYAVRLDRVRATQAWQSLLQPMDRHGILANPNPISRVDMEDMDDDSLLAELGVHDVSDDITILKHVRSASEKRAAEEIADRKKCDDFETFRPVFARAETELKAGLLQSQPISAGRRGIEPGDIFVLAGVMLYVAEVGAPLKTTAGEIDSRLRVVYANGTESDLLLRSLQRAFYNDPAARRLVAPDSGQFSFGDTFDADDVESGTIYVLRSLSTNPYVMEHQKLLHKIGVTGGSVEARIANAESESTYLLSKVEVIATYKLAGINRAKLENVLHRIFDAARVSVEIRDRFGRPVEPREWFLVPLFVIDEAVKRIKDGTITLYVYDPGSAKLVLAEDTHQ